MNSNFTKWVLSQVLVVVMLVAAGSALAAPGDQLIHNSNNLGTKYGNWGVVGGKYGEFTCTTCHSTRVAPTSNVKRIAGTITAPLGNWSSSKALGVTVVFNNMTAFGTDAAAHTTSTSVCQVCHSKTAVHRYDKPVGQAESDHQGANQTDCTACHSHANAFKPQGCISCHGGNLASGTPMASGQHTAHINNATVLGLNYGCVDCHAKTVTADETIKSAPTAHRNGTYGDYSGIRAGKNYSAGNCSNVYCHTNGKGGAAATAVNWSTGPALDCKGCHGGGSSQAGEPVYVSGGAGASDANSHPKHVGTTGANTTCQNCHGATMNGTALNATGKHTDMTIDVLQGNSKTFSYTAGTKTCSTSSCHSNGLFTAADVRWGATMPADCTGCHGSEVNAATKLSGAHDSHLNHASAGGVFTCKDCHAPTITNADNRTIANSANHMNAALNYSGAKSGKTKNCSNIYCHSNGKGSFAVVPAWTSGTDLTCQGCHATTDLITGSHSEHIAKSALCSNCHNSTTSDNATITGATHIDGSVTMQQGGTFPIISKSVVFAYAGAGTCNNISCHSTAAVGPYSNTATWGVKSNCATCHPTLSGHHTVHMGALNLTDSSLFYNMTANRSPVQNDTVKTHGFGCANCHPLNKSNHLNGSIDVDMSSKDVTGTSSIRFLNSTTAGQLPTYSGGTCANIYCHSNASRVPSELVYKPTPTWVGGSFSGDRCAACHDNQPATGAHAAHAVGNHVDNVYNGKSGKITVSARANTTHGNPNNSTTIGCYICHQATVTSKANDKNTKCAVCHYSGNTVGATLKGSASISNLKNHVNGAREIQFLPVKVISKAQVRPKGPLNPSAVDQRSGFDFYSGIWSRTSYKNMTTLSFDTAKVALDTATMWHPSTPMASNCTNIACHNGRTVSWNLANWNDPNKCMDCHNAL